MYVISVLLFLLVKASSTDPELLLAVAGASVGGMQAVLVDSYTDGVVVVGGRKIEINGAPVVVWVEEGEEEVSVTKGGKKVVLQVSGGGGVVIVGGNQYTVDLDPGLLPAVNTNHHERGLTVHIGGQVSFDVPSIVSEVHSAAEIYKTYIRPAYLSAWSAPDTNLLLKTSQNIMLPSQSDLCTGAHPMIQAACTVGYYTYQYRLLGTIPDSILHDLLECDVETCEAMITHVRRSFPAWGRVTVGGLEVIVGGDSETMSVMQPHAEVVLVTEKPVWELGGEMLETLFENVAKNDISLALVSPSQGFYGEGEICQGTTPCLHQFYTTGLTKASTAASSWGGFLAVLSEVYLQTIPVPPGYAYTPRPHTHYLSRNFLHVTQPKKSDRLTVKPVTDANCDGGSFCPTRYGVTYQVLFENFYGMVMGAVVVLPSVAGAIVLGLR